MPTIPTQFLAVSQSRHIVRFAGHRINQSAIARALKIDTSHLSRILVGDRQPSIRLANKLAGTLGMSIEALMEAITHRRRLLKRRSRAFSVRHVSL